MRSSVVLIAVVAAGLSSPALAAGKKSKAPVSAPSTPPVVAPVEPAAPPPPPVAELKPAEPPPPVAEQPVRVAREDGPPLPEAPRGGFELTATGGVVMPFHVLGVGGRAELRASYFLPAAPLGFSLSAAFEQHTAQGPAVLSPPRGGLDPAALDNQTLLPLQALVHVLILRDAHNRLRLGAGYAALITWTQTQALGIAAEETGVGHEVLGELGYARRFGALELEFIARYSVRSTAVGRASAALELPWYQTAGVLVGLGFAP